MAECKKDEKKEAKTIKHKNAFRVLMDGGSKLMKKMLEMRKNK